MCVCVCVTERPECGWCVTYFLAKGCCCFEMSVSLSISSQAQIVRREVEYAKLPLRQSKVAAVSTHTHSHTQHIMSFKDMELRRELGDRFEHFQSLDSFEKSSYVLGSEAWEEYSSGLLGLIKDFVLSVWEERKVRLYGEHANVHQSHSQNDSGDLRGVAGGDGELGCLCGKAGTSHLCDGSAHSSGCVVNGNAMAAV